MTTKYTLDALTTNSVSVKTQQYTTIDDVEYAIGQPHRKAYINSTAGRVAIADLPTDQYNAIMAVWGDTATVTDPA